MKYYKYIVIFLSILILLLGGYIIYVQSTITPLDNNDIKEENNKDSINNIDVYKRQVLWYVSCYYC